MKMTISLPLCTVLLFLASETLATQRCNLYNFGVQGAYKCGLEWWQARDLGQVNTSTYKVSDIVEKSLIHMRISVNDIKLALEGKLKANTTDPLAKIIESALTVEPYLTYAVSDLILGMDITADDLKRFGLPEDLAIRKNLTKLFTDYMEIGCSSYGVKPFVSCMTNWMTENCDATEDRTQVIVDFLATMRDAYCTGAAAVKPALIKNLTMDLGTVFKTIPEFLRVYKDPNGPYLFNISKDSVIFDRTLWQRAGALTQQKCGYLIQTFTADLPELIGQNATSGAGQIMESLLRARDGASRCIFRVMNDVLPNLFTKNKKAFEHMELVGGRYGFSEITHNKTNVATEERHSVTVYGDPHMVPYKFTKTVTCPAIGQKIYLANEFFTLHGVAEPVSISSQATYVISVLLTFSDRDVAIRYESAAGELSSVLTVHGINGTSKVAEYDNITVSSFGERVQIVDLKSGAVFGFRKYKETYYFTVRAGAKVLDGSLGLLITGCSSPVAINKGRRRRSTKCQTACAAVPADYINTCNYDCVETGDTAVANISRGIVSLKNQVEEEDVEVFKSLGVTLQPTTTVKPKDSDGRGDACQHLPNLMLVLILSFPVRYL